MRLILALATLVSVILAPWWVALLFSIALSLRWRAWEVICFGILLDLLYVSGISFSLTGLPWGTIIGMLLVFGLEPFRRRLLTGSATF